MYQIQRLSQSLREKKALIMVHQSWIGASWDRAPDELDPLDVRQADDIASILQGCACVNEHQRQWVS